MSAIDNPLRTFTEEKTQRRQTLNRALQMQALGHLASSAAHDLDDLIAVIVCNAAVLRRKLRGNSMVAGELESLDLTTHAAGDIVHSLMSCHHSAAPQNELIDLNVFMKDTMRLLELLLPSHIHLDARWESAASLWVKGDRSQLRHVLLKLAVNARDSMPNGGTLHISIATATNGVASRDDKGMNRNKSIRLTVADTGSGLSADHLSRIFEPPCTTKSPREGSGLGLSIVQDIIRAHEGRVEVHSSLGNGTTFTILLPLSRPNVFPLMFDESEPFIAG